MSPHLLRCQGLAVDDYSFTLGRLKAGATSTFVQLGCYIDQNVLIMVNLGAGTGPAPIGVSGPINLS